MQPKLSFPLLALFGLTRGLAGIGLGLLLADHIAHDRRKQLGKVLFGVGAASTIPLIATIIHRSRHPEPAITEVYTSSVGTVSDAELVESPEQAEIPTIRP